MNHTPPKLSDAVATRSPPHASLYKFRALILQREHQTGPRFEVLHGVLHVVGGRPPEIVGSADDRGTCVLTRLDLWETRKKTENEARVLYYIAISVLEIWKVTWMANNVRKNIFMFAW